MYSIIKSVCKKGECIIILNKKIKHYTKGMFRLITLVAIALFIIMSVILMKYQMVCEVTVNGEKLGNISNKEKFEQDLNDFINAEEANKEYTTIENMPAYDIKLVDKSAEISDEAILAKIEENAETTYKFYAVTIDGKEKAVVADLDEAEKLVKELSDEYEEYLEIKVGVVEKITVNDKEGVTEVKTAEKNITKELDKKVEEKEEKEAEEYYYYVASTQVASLNGVKLSVTPVSGIITSRFGSRESIRSYGHTGVDIATSEGTDIRAAAGGTVTFAGESGGYGNLVKISHGSGITTYYGHCSAIYVSEGDVVNAGDVIAAVGSTGNSTGPHLHFEVVKDGVELDPQNYLYQGE